MRIVLDLQGCQTKSRFQGIGRYSGAFAAALAKNAGKHEVWLALNGSFPDTVEPARAAFGGLIPRDRIRVFELPDRIAGFEPQNYWRARSAELLREAFLSGLKPDIVHISSLFEGLEDDACASIGISGKNHSNSATLYACDLPPLLERESGINFCEKKDWYFRKKASLKRADVILAASEYCAKNASEVLSLPRDKAVCIYAGIKSCFRPYQISAESKSKILNGSGIKNKFILFSGDIGKYSNIDRLIGAFGLLGGRIKGGCQLVIAGKIPPEQKHALLLLTKETGLAENSLVFAGYMEGKELADMYNLCSAFVFPPLCESTGLPPLEAMSCGAPAICSNAGGVAEFACFKGALFDPGSPESIAGKMYEALTDKSFALKLKEHGLKLAKKFSWDESAKKAINCFEAACEESNAAGSRRTSLPLPPASGRRLALAFVSPVPPEKTGIASYSAELLPELSRYYGIDVITDQKDISDPFIKANFAVRNTEWFDKNAGKFDRILYQFGNSHFHAHMFGMLKKHPGVAVLHELFLSDVQNWIELEKKNLYNLSKSLYGSHGYGSLIFKEKNGLSEAIDRFPSSCGVFKHAFAVIMHSSFAADKAAGFYGAGAAEKIFKIPHLRVKPGLHREESRMRLGLSDKDFLICSFGMLNPLKFNDVLLETYLGLPLSEDRNCMLVFAGECLSAELEKKMLASLEKNGNSGRIRITGFIPDEVYKDYLNSADMAVQLRRRSRGETSGAVLDCLAHGIPLIINGTGPNEEIPESAAVKLNGEFTRKELGESILNLRKDKARRRELSVKSREYVSEFNSPFKTGKLYFETIERSYGNGAEYAANKLIREIGRIDCPVKPSDDDLLKVSRSIFANHPPFRQYELLIDVSAIAELDLNTGIQRVVKSLVKEMIKNPPRGYRIEPVYLSDKGGYWHYVYARNWTLKTLGIAHAGIGEETAEARRGDVFLGLDFHTGGVRETEKTGLYAAWRNRGAGVYFVVYDILPVLMPEVFPQKADKYHEEWLRAISKAADGLICISRSVAEEVSGWLNGKNLQRQSKLKIGHFPLGADITDGAPAEAKGLPEDAEGRVLSGLKSRPSFLMVGTIEPRKGYLQTIAAFERLWKTGMQVNLIIVGKEGWESLPDGERRTIPLIAGKLKNHPELGRRLFWLGGISDEYLEKVYSVSTCLIAASENEGFGLPIIEAARHKLPIVARDIPVFREVAGVNAFYFSGQKPEHLSGAIEKWLNLYGKNRAPKPDGLKWLTWEESAKRLAEIILCDISQ